MIFLTFLTAMALSGVAAYYSVIGLAAIFPGSFWPVVLMGSVLEGAKLVTVSWLYRNWKQVPILMKSYLVTASFILMLITSMGIFGYLSKAHLEHSADTAPLALKVEMLDEKIRIAKENINEDRKALKQMDEAVDQIMGRSTDEKGADKAVAVRRGQAKERTRLLSNIETQQKVIAELGVERTPLYVELSKAESDFGPIKYVAELIYGSGEKDIIDKAVRLVIMLIMVVFDPLAVLLLIAANMSMNKTEERIKKVEEDEFKPDPWVADVGEKPTKEELEEIDEPINCYKCGTELLNAPGIGPFCPNKKCDVLDGPFVEHKDETIKIDKNNVTNIIIDEATGESIPPITEPTHEKITVHLSPGLHEEHHVPIKKLEPKYDYDEPYSFREKENK